MKALVTGAAGFIGSHLAERLLEEHAEVVGIDCFSDYYARDLKEANLESLRSRRGFQFFEMSVQDISRNEMLCDVTHVFHLAAQPGVRKSWGANFGDYINGNIQATQVLLEAAISAPLERFVYASSSSVYGDGVKIPMREDTQPQPISPYGVTKLTAEQLCHLYWTTYDVPAVALRYFTVYGPRQRPDMAFNRFLRALLSDSGINLYGNGQQTRDFTFVEDAVRATVAAGNVGVPGQVYNVGGGSRVTINHVLEIMARLTNRQPIIHHEDPQKGDMRDTYADTSKAHADLGFSPRVTLENGIQAEFQWISSTLALI